MSGCGSENQNQNDRVCVCERVKADVPILSLLHSHTLAHSLTHTFSLTLTHTLSLILCHTHTLSHSHSQFSVGKETLTSSHATWGKKHSAQATLTAKQHGSLTQSCSNNPASNPNQVCSQEKAAEAATYPQHSIKTSISLIQQDSPGKGRETSQRQLWQPALPRAL